MIIEAGIYLPKDGSNAAREADDTDEDEHGEDIFVEAPLDMPIPQCHHWRERESKSERKRNSK